jgi:hypothetical protein
MTKRIVIIAASVLAIGAGLAAIFKRRAHK